MVKFSGGTSPEVPVNREPFAQIIYVLGGKSKPADRSRHKIFVFGMVLYYTESMKLLLHACCAPCSIQCVQALKEEALIPDLFWYNPNIHPYTEYRSRRDTLSRFAAEEHLNLFEDGEYGLRLFLSGLYAGGEGASNYPWEAPARCAFCYNLRLGKAAAYAADKGYEAFTTTLLISPYQNHDILRETGEKLAAQYNVNFFYRDFRPRFREGQKLAKERAYYMQSYCGCIFSEEERYLKK
jgi:predicted adenine nucleotide alpha hydrolase (AANH) superfamily ATPase